MDTKRSYPKFNVAEIEAKKSKIVSTAESLSDVVRFNWDKEVLSGNKEVIITTNKS